MRTARVVVATLPVVMLAILGGCEKAGKPAEQAAAAAAAPAPVAPRTVHVVGTDFAFHAPDTLPAGLTSFHLMNQGKELHQIMLLRLAPGRTVADLEKRKAGEPPPPDLMVIGGPNAAAPGGTAEAIVNLKPGSYAMVCGIPSTDGMPHMMKGMIRALTVVEGASAAQPPSADVTIKLAPGKTIADFAKWAE